MPHCKKCKDTKSVSEARRTVPCPACVPVDPLPDEIPMPFGRHQGTPLSQVPARYLLKIGRESIVRELYPILWEWIERNSETLQWERERD